MKAHALASMLLLLAAGCDGDARARGPISGEEVAAHVRVLAADSMGGRGAGTFGFARAAAYAVRTFREAGADPLIWPDAGAPTYLQRVPLTILGDDAAGALVVDDGSAPNTIPLDGEQVIVLVPGKLPGPVPPAAPVFVGYGIYDAVGGWDDYAGLDVRGRVVLAVEGPPEPAHVPGMPAAVRVRFRDPVAANNHKVGVAMVRGAAAVLVLAPPSGMDWKGFRSGRPRVLPAWTEPGLPVRDHTTPVLAIHPALADRLLARSGLELYRATTRYRPLTLTDVRLGLQLQARRTAVTSPNVIAVVPGNDPRRRSEYVLVSAHLDGLGTQDGRVFPGANDDASGSAVVLALARTLALRPPSRSVLLALFTAEEAGLLGSRWFAGHLPVPRSAIRANVNLEHLGHTSDRPCLVLAPATLRPAAIAAQHAAPDLALDIRDPADAPAIYASGDNQSLARIGVPALSFGCGGDELYHQPADRAERIAPETLRQAAAVAEAMVMTLAGGRE